MFQKQRQNGSLLHVCAGDATFFVAWGLVVSGMLQVENSQLFHLQQWVGRPPAIDNSARKIEIEW
jgi:hypothetical protein